jgi:hypothetical protein
MIKLTNNMRRMINDPEFFGIVKAICEVETMVRDYQRKHSVERRQRIHDDMMARPADVAYPVEYHKSNSKVKPARPLVPVTVATKHLDD